MSDSERQNLLIKAIFEASPEGILVVDDRNIILSHNSQFVDIWRIPTPLLHGLQDGTAIGLDDSQVFSAALELVKDKPTFQARVKDLYNNPHLKDVCEIDLLDGRTIERHSTALYSNAGQYLGRVWFFRDITALKQLENVQEHISSQEKYHTILKTATDGFWTVDKNGRFLEVNDAYCTMSGYSREELLRMHIPDLEVAEAPEDTRKHIEKIIAQGSDRFETQHRRKDGGILDVEISTQYMPLVDQMFVVFVKDITSHKRAEAELIAARVQAEQANHAKSQFLMGISHELRTPLNAILGFAQLLELNSDTNSPEQQDYAKHILTAGKHLLELVDSVLELAHIDAGKIEIHSIPVCIADVVSSCIDQITVTMAQKRHITIDNQITDLNLLVQGDELRLREVLFNLLGNAVKYNNDNGRVTLRAVAEKKDRVKIIVQDTCESIAAEKLPLLFTPFERIDQKHGAISGVGIGLYVTKRLIEEMHGSIGVESEPGKGNTFWFEIPLALNT